MAIEDDFYFDNSIPTRRQLMAAIADIFNIRAEIAVDPLLKDDAENLDTQLQELADFFGLIMAKATHFVPLHAN